MIRMHAAAGVEEGPVGLVEVHPAAQRRQFLLREVRDVPFDAVVAKERGGSTEVKAVAAPRGVRGGPADVSSHQLVGHKESGVGLVVEPFQRIYAVTCPDPVGPVQHGKVHACPAGGTGLDFQAGVMLLEGFHQPVHGTGVFVHRCLPRGRAGGVKQVAVVIPLDVVDRVLIQDAVHRLENVIPRGRKGQVQDLLLAGRNGHPAVHLQYPLGVGPGQFAVRIDHLRLKPEAELHSEAADVVDDRAEAIRPDGPVHTPVAKSRGVVAAPEEPAVVEDEAFGSRRSRGGGYCLQPGEVVVEVDGFPAVHSDRPRGPWVVGACAEVLVEARGQFVQPVSPGADGPRGAVALARLQAHLTRQQELGGCQEVLSVDAPLGTEAVIPAPGQMYGVNPAGAEAETLGPGCHEQ